MEELNTKRGLLESILKNIFNSTSVSVPYYDKNDVEKVLDTQGYHISRIKFNKNYLKHYQNVFEYVFTNEKLQDKFGNEIVREEIFRKAIAWLSTFFNLTLSPTELINSTDLNDLGKKLLECYTKLLYILFVDSDNSKDGTIDCNKIRADCSDIIRSKLEIDVKTSKPANPFLHISTPSMFDAIDKTTLQMTEAALKIKENTKR